MARDEALASTLVAMANVRHGAQGRTDGLEWSVSLG